MGSNPIALSIIEKSESVVQWSERLFKQSLSIKVIECRLYVNPVRIKEKTRTGYFCSDAETGRQGTANCAA